jgi:4-alpha-glucanotransferase
LGIWSYHGDDVRARRSRLFPRPDHYSANALVTFNTHDLSTYAGWRSFGDLKTKRSLGIDPGESDDARWHALAMLDDVLRRTPSTATMCFRAELSRANEVAAARGLAGGYSRGGGPANIPAPSTNIRTGGGGFRCRSSR